MRRLDIADERVPDAGALTGDELVPVYTPPSPGGLSSVKRSNIAAVAAFVAALTGPFGFQEITATGNAAQDEALLEGAMAEGTVALLRGNFVIANPLVGEHAVVWQAAEDSTISAAALAGNDKAIYFTGSQTAARALSATGTINTNTLTCSDVSGIDSGTLLRVASDDSVCPVRTNTPAGEYAVVKSVSGTTITLWTKLRFTYATNPRIRIVTPLRGLDLSGIRIQGAEDGSTQYMSGLVVQMAVQPRITGGWVRNCSGASVQLQDCLGGLGDGVETTIERPTNEGYGFAVSGCSERVTIRGHISNGCRHAITTSSSNTAGYEGTVRNTVYEEFTINGTQTNVAGSVGGAALDTHANGDRFTARNGEINNSSGLAINVEQASFLGENIRIVGGATHNISLFNFTSLDGSYTLRNVQVEGGTDVIRCFDGQSSATGKTKRLVLDNVSAKSFTGQFLEQESTSATKETIIHTQGIDVDASSTVSNSSPVIDLSGAKEWRSISGTIKGVLAGGIAVQWENIAGLEGALPTVEFRVGSNSSGTAYKALYTSATTIAGFVTGRVVATATNTAKAFDLDAETRGLDIRRLESNCNTPFNIASGATYIPPRGQRYATAARPVVPATAGIEIYDTDIVSPIYSDGSGGWRNAIGGVA